MKKIFLILFLFLFLIQMSYAVSLEDKIGQMIIVGYDGDNIHSRGFKRVLKQSKQGQISGVILFSKNIKSKEDLIKMNNKLILESKIYPFISIDNEGGYVQRYDFIQHKSAKVVSKLTELEAQEEYSIMADTLNELKFNLNFAPCVDLEINKNSIISKKERSYGIDKDIVSKYARIFIEEHNKKDIITSIKHFPGHGSVTGDTHKGFVDATKTYKPDEIMPYYDLTDLNKMNMVMVSHIFNSDFDSYYPSSLSYKTVNDILIKKIGFSGVIVSDDYDMGAIRDNYSLRDIVVNSINSGINLMIFSNNIKTKDKNVSKKIIKIVKKEIDLGNIDINLINNSYEKIMNLKKNYK